MLSLLIPIAIGTELIRVREVLVRAISLTFLLKKARFCFARMKHFYTFASHSKSNAQVAELVDALVSNTSGATRAGSIPALGTEKSS